MPRTTAPRTMTDEEKAERQRVADENRAKREAEAAERLANIPSFKEATQRTAAAHAALISTTRLSMSIKGRRTADVRNGLNEGISQAAQEYVSAMEIQDLANKKENGLL